jgi:hypothetical protein
VLPITLIKQSDGAISVLGSNHVIDNAARRVGAQHVLIACLNPDSLAWSNSNNYRRMALASYIITGGNRLGTKQEIEDDEQTLETVSLTEGVTERELQVLRSRITFLEQFREGIQPSDVTQIHRAEEGEPKQKYYAQMNAEERLEFLAQLWNQDIFVSFLWEFQGVLHFK